MTMELQIWDNPKAGKKSERYTILQNGRVHVSTAMGEWQYICSSREVDKKWMDANQVQVDAKDLPVEVQAVIDRMV